MNNSTTTTTVTEVTAPTTTEHHTTLRDYDMLDMLLDRETQNNKAKSWNKLDKTQKLQKLHAFAERYVKDHVIPTKDIKALKQFFSQSLNSAQLQKTSDVIYNKDLREITLIPALHYHTETHTFFLKNMDPKHVSTLKSLTPKRTV